MKTLTNTKTVVEGNKVTITAEIIDYSFGMPCQAVTVGHGSATNIHHPRHVQISNEALFVKRMGNHVIKKAELAWLIDELVDIFINIEPGLTDAPVFMQQPKPDSLAAIVVNSELPYTVLWEWSPDGKTDWTTADKAAIPDGAFHRCTATNAAGSTLSNVVKQK